MDDMSAAMLAVAAVCLPAGFVLGVVVGRARMRSQLTATAAAVAAPDWLPAPVIEDELRRLTAAMHVDLARAALLAPGDHRDLVAIQVGMHALAWATRTPGYWRPSSFVEWARDPMNVV